MRRKLRMTYFRCKLNLKQMGFKYELVLSTYIKTDSIRNVECIAKEQFCQTRRRFEP